MKFDILGFGSLAERFACAALGELKQANPQLQLEVRVSDIYGPNDSWRQGTRQEWLDGLRRQSGTNFKYHRRKDYEKVLAEKAPDILMIATPPTRHAFDLEHMTQILGTQKKSIIGVEKPFMHLGARAKVRKLLAQSNQQVCDIDFFNQGKAFLWLMTSPEGQDILQQFGIPLVINGNCVETMTEWRDWMFNQKISGGGTFVDCGSHNVNMMYVFMHHIYSLRGKKPDFGKPQIKNSIFGKYHNNPSLRETYSLLQVKWRDILWNIQDGKALPKTAYNLESMSEDGNYLLVSVGTEFHSPFILFAPNSGEPKLYTFDGPGVGYRQIFERLIVMSSNPNVTVFPDPAASRYASFELLLELEAGIRRRQKENIDWCQYDNKTPVGKRKWPNKTTYLPVTDDGFGMIPSVK